MICQFFDLQNGMVSVPRHGLILLLLEYFACQIEIMCRRIPRVEELDEGEQMQ